MGGVAILLLALLLSRAILTVDPYFDSFAYHLPFAARLAGLCPKSCYQMGAYLEAVYDGFPKLFHVFQGLAWRITGRAQVVDVLNLGASSFSGRFASRRRGLSARCSPCRSSRSTLLRPISTCP
jgi:hypothetical protein